METIFPANLLDGTDASHAQQYSSTRVIMIIGPILWGHSGPLCHVVVVVVVDVVDIDAQAARATVPLAASGKWA